MDYTDLIGKRFGKLTVLHYAGIYYGAETKGRSRYFCKCDCGKNILAERHKLISGSCKSCGDCNKIVAEYDYLRYYCKNGDSFIFDKEDLPLIQMHKWHISRYGYVSTRIKNKNYRLSRLLTNVCEGKYVDHKNGNTRDNRRNNLRIAQIIDNCRNMKIPAHNSTGYKGVSYDKDRGKFKAYISLMNKTKYIGRYTNPEDAAMAYDKAARKYFGEYACLNFPTQNERGCRQD